MNLTDLRDALEELAGPIESPTRGELAAVERRVRRWRLVRATSATALVLAVGLGVFLVAAPWTDDPKSTTQVVTSGGTEVHDERLGYSVTVPPGWEHETPEVHPRDELPSILTLSYDYTPPFIGATCATSVDQIGIHIGLQEHNVEVQENPDFPTLFGPKPDPFGPDSGDGLRSFPDAPPCHRLQQGIMFEDHGRRFYMSITMPEGTSPDRRAEVYAILDSLRFDRDTIVESVPDTGGSTTTTFSTAG